MYLPRHFDGKKYMFSFLFSLLAEDAFFSHFHNLGGEAPKAIDGIIGQGNKAIVESRDPYSFIVLDLGSVDPYSQFQISLVVVHLRVECCRDRIYDIQATIGDVMPVDPLGK